MNAFKLICFSLLLVSCAPPLATPTPRREPLAPPSSASTSTTEPTATFIPTSTLAPASTATHPPTATVTLQPTPTPPLVTEQTLLFKCFPSYLAPTPVSPAEVRIPITNRYPSPDQKYYVGDNYVFDLWNNRCARLGWMKWHIFNGWTSDSRYAVFSPYDQYGMTFTAVFDTTAWQWLDIDDKTHSSRCDMLAGCRQQATRAIAPHTSRLALESYTLVDLDSRAYITVTPPLAANEQAFRAVWSSDESQLAWLVCQYDAANKNQLAVYLTLGDGVRGRQLKVLPTRCSSSQMSKPSLTWAADGRAIIVDTGEALYTLPVD